MMPNKIPALFASLKDTSHLGTFFIEGGGKEADAAAAFLDWKTRGDESKKALFCPPAGGQSSSKAATSAQMAEEGWKISTKNGMC
jgi:hypothetical protein